MVSGQLSHEMKIEVPATEAWELYGTLRLANLVEEVSTLIEKIEVLEGDGGLGTVLKLTFVPGTPGLSSSSEKFTKIDNEKRVKETEAVEGGYLEMGFTLYRIRFEVIEEGDDSCIIRSTIEYDVKEEAAANASYVTIEPLEGIAQIAKSYLTKNKAAK
ncbi:norbelladine synthase-like [Juglans microcarpa x Juglans regia]|uniref:norbelladine synthase-like n=1 Tax=Juglans microcarpa x Juglans regia TaxID=2249226 RepID=UPI001B7E55D7|nr:norbelladine synthase-like [Juglans microcarpa x Juglans regia]